MMGRPARVVGRYLVCAPIASGGMARVHLGRLLGLEGFSRTVAIKRLHAQLAQDPEFVSMFLDEARLASRIRHPNVVAPIDVVALDGEIFIVMEYVQGEAVSRLIQMSGNAPVPPAIVASVMYQVLLGLHAAHEASDERGKPLDIVHRDVSPQNILVGEDGVARVVDFGIAKAARRVHSTDGGKLKGKLGYMAPEQLRLEPLDRRCDVFAAGLVLWEMLTGQKLFPPDEPAGSLERMLRLELDPPSHVVPTITAELDAVVMKALQRNREARFDDARQMAVLLQSACAPAPVLEVGAWVQRVAGPALRQRAAWVADAENLNLDELTIARPSLGQAGRLRSAQPPDSTQGFALLPRAEITDLSIVPTREPTRPRMMGASRRGRKALLVVLSVLALAACLGVATLVVRGRSWSGARPATITVLSTDPAWLEDSPRPGASTGPPMPPLAPPNERQENEARAGDAGTGVPPSAPDTRETKRNPATEPKTEPGRKREPKSAPRKSARCDVPYTLDERGIKRFRPECF